MPGANLHVYHYQGGMRKKPKHLFIWKRYRAVAELVRNLHILGEILSAKPSGAHPQLIASCLPDAIPLDSSKQKGKVLPCVLAGMMHVPVLLSLSRSPWRHGQLAGWVVYVIPRQNPLSLPSGITKCYCLTPVCTSLLTDGLAFFLAPLHQQ